MNHFENPMSELVAVLFRNIDDEEEYKRARYYEIFTEDYGLDLSAPVHTEGGWYVFPVRNYYGHTYNVRINKDIKFRYACVRFQ